MNNVNLSSPWDIYAKKVTALFSGDPDVKVAFNEDTTTLSLYVTGLMGKKAEAIEKILPSNIKMGNITMNIEVIPGDDAPNYAQLIEAAFYGNENFVGVKGEEHGIYGTTTYGLFCDKTLQFYTDDLTEYGGMTTAVVADIAKDVLTTPESGFYFSTEV